MVQVAFVSRYVPQYREDFLTRTRERLAGDGIRFRVVHGQPSAKEAAKGDAVSLEWGERVDSRIFPMAGREMYWQPVLGRVWHDDLVIVEQGSRLLVNYPLVAAQRLGGPPLAFWGHGLHFAAHEVTGSGEAAKRALARRAHWWFAYTERSAGIVSGLGYPRERVTVVQNAIDTRAIREWRAALSADSLDGLRAKLRLGRGPVGVFCGALYPEKRLAFLVQACDRVRERLPSFEMLVIGGGEDEVLVRAAAADRPWLKFLGARFGADKVRHLALGDVFLMPGLVGLAILDAFALELPLVTTSVPYHSHEVSYLDDGVNGVMIEDADDPAAYATAVADLLGDASRLETLREGCRRAAEVYTVENMTARFCEGVAQALNAEPWRVSRRPRRLR